MNSSANKSADKSTARVALVAIVACTPLLLALAQPLNTLRSIRVSLQAYNSPVRAYADSVNDHNAIKCRNDTEDKVYVGGRDLTALNGYPICNAAACANEAIQAVDGTELYLLLPAIHDGGVYEVGDGTAEQDPDYPNHCGSFLLADGGVTDAGACPTFPAHRDVPCLTGR